MKLLLPTILILLAPFTTTALPATTTPPILLPPKSFQVKVVTSPADGCKTVGYLTLPPPPLEGALPHITSTPSTLFFNQKNPAGLGWLSNGAVYYAPGWYIFTYTLNATSSASTSSSSAHEPPHSKLYLDDLTSNGAWGYMQLIVQATHLFGDGNLYLKGIVSLLDGGTTVTNPATFSWDSSSKELFVSTKPWSKQTVYLQVVPLMIYGYNETW